MAFDQATRNRLQKFVSEARDLLQKELTRQMQHDFGMDPETGNVSEIDKLTHLDDARQETARMLRDTFDHYMAAQPFGGKKGTLERIAREQAFTVLNRLCALRMAEARGFLIESIGSGYQSKGFQLYARLAGHSLGELGEAYQCYLFSLFDEFAVDLPVLFDRYSAMGRLFPKDTALRELLDLINAPDIASLWAEDEAIGWVYQYFNSKEERRQMRDASQAPRNSRELAVRNQFFTPRYVVEFLTDNTLGRIWYEMTQGNTALTEDCQYLVRRPDEVFLSVEQGPVLDWFQGNAQETEPRVINIAHSVNGYLRAGGLHEGAQEWLEQQLEGIQNNQAESFSTQIILDILFVIHQVDRFCEGTLETYQKEIGRLMAALRQRVEESQKEDLSQQDLLNQSVFIPLRPMKDPRDIKILDPACGSGHFLLYAFDLLETIYKEYWNLEDQAEYSREDPSKGLSPLKEVYKTKDALIADLPRLVIEYNLHGIDIDPRAVQIAGLSLWLRAQRGWQEQGIKPNERPAIQKSNVVCAEPMPGETDMLREFADSLKPKVLGQLVEIIFEKMELAGEAGPLLKIEEEIAEAVDNAREEFNKELLRRKEEAGYLPGMAPKDRERSIFDFSDLPDKTRFWEIAEDKILGALQDYAEKFENGDNSRRRLFANDAAKGFAFIDLCRKRYDAVLMNPPFGDTPRKVYAYLENKYPQTKFEFHTAFMERALNFNSSDGYSAYISNRTWFSLYRLDLFRKNIVMGNQLEIIADLGIGVLDDALVEAACTIIRNNISFIDYPIVFRLINVKHKEQEILDFVKFDQTIYNQIFLPKLSILKTLPRSIFGYWFPHHLAYSLSIMEPLYPNHGFSRQGLASRDDYRFLRLRWEVNIPDLETKWSPFAKGGEYEPFFDDIHLLIDFSKNGKELKSYIVDVKGEKSWSRNIPSSDMFGKPGLTYPERTTSDFGPRPLPSNSIFSATGQAIFPKDRNSTLFYLGMASSRIFKQLIELFIGGGDATESGSAARDYTSGILNEIPFPVLSSLEKDRVSNLVLECLKEWMKHFSCMENSFLFVTPALISEVETPMNLNSLINILTDRTNSQILEIGERNKEIDQLIARAYGIEKDNMDFLDEEVCPFPFCYRHTSNEPIDISSYNDLSELIASVCSKNGFKRAYTKKSHWTDRKLELLAHLFHVHPKKIIENGYNVEAKYLKAPTTDLISYLFGACIGRWDIRYATGEKETPELPDPFETLPRCPPGMLKNSEGLPTEPKDVPADYPIRITWNGILVDDEGHPEDIIARVREAIEVLWKDKKEDIEQEAIEILGVNSLREYFSKPNKFFADHLKRYSKSRRQAPIYWPLSTPSGSYTIWLYYHRLTDQTLYTCVNDYVEEQKIKEVTNSINALQAKSKRSRQEEKQLEDLSDFHQELVDFRDELLRIAKFWKPDLNDGVQITAAPLWKLFRHRPWQNKLKETWEKLEKGDYGWAHLALPIWPGRVVKAAHKDRSIAIAHDLEEDLWEEVEKSRDRKGNPKYQWQPKNLSQKELDSIAQSISSAK